LEAKPWVSLIALEISFDNPVLHRNLSGSFEDEDDEHEEESSIFGAKVQGSELLNSCNS
jgi:hypothetical protein